ncbi:MAG TPA: phosphatase PAP2 family protein [Saprospiraceae bacterium]|nr:phosphatase PAP2 family protein [Saprospiraceae bacterium]
MNWIDPILSIDRTLFHLINTGLGNPVFDALLPWCREKWIWAPFYVFIAAFSWMNYGKKGWVIVLGMVLAAGLADFTSSTLIKKNVQRLRPCNDPVMQDDLVLRVDHCGSGYSFTSSHSSNHFAAAFFLIGMFGAFAKGVRPALLGWAGLIALSQVYVGVHYPFDVLAGAILGSLLGWLVARGAKKLLDTRGLA